MIADKKFLIWFVCFGTQYHKEMTFLSILSILHYTNYKGDIVVLSDTDHFSSELPNVRIINISNEYQVKNKFNVYCMKTKIHEYIDIEQYDFCLYLDSDILIRYENLQELFYYWSFSQKILLIDNEGCTVKKNIPNTGSQILTDEEKQKYSDFQVCAGMFGIPVNKNGIDFLNYWNNLNDLNHDMDDQGNLYATLIRNNFNFMYCDAINRNKWNFDKITHYHSSSRKIFWHHCRTMLGDHLANKRFEGVYSMSKPCENVNNTWNFKDNIVYVDRPTIVGFVQDTLFGTYIWWPHDLEFEKINENGCFSSKQSEQCFYLNKQ